jgi:hypothetical protein
MLISQPSRRVIAVSLTVPAAAPARPAGEPQTAPKLPETPPPEPVRCTA